MSLEHISTILNRVFKQIEVNHGTMENRLNSGVRQRDRNGFKDTIQGRATTETKVGGISKA